MDIRKETIHDISEIHRITIEAFKVHPVSQHTEQFIINALRKDGALSLSLVAVVNCEIVGHIAFSPVRIDKCGENWYGLGPVSVIPRMQRRGIGKGMIAKGFSLIKEMGGHGCVLVGDPRYYKKLGFNNVPELIYEGIPQEYFLGYSFIGSFPKGIVKFHNGFTAKE